MTVHGVMFVTKASFWAVQINTILFQVSYWFSDASNIAVWEASPKVRTNLVATDVRQVASSMLAIGLSW